jgi:hypothetical protein
VADIQGGGFASAATATATAVALRLLNEGHHFGLGPEDISPSDLHPLGEGTNSLKEIYHVPGKSSDLLDIRTSQQFVISHNTELLRFRVQQI